MSTINGTTELGPASAKRQVYSPLEDILECISGVAQTQKLRTQLCRPDRQRACDIGVTRGEIDYVASHRGIDPRSIRSAE
jgi:hypothetical protein